MMKLRMVSPVVAVLSALSLAPAQASTVYDWTLSGAGASGSGTITLGAKASGTAGLDGGFTVDAVSGEIDGSDITGLTNFYGSDNLIFPANGTVVDDFGLSVLLASGLSVAIDPGGPYNVQISSPNETLQHESFALTAATAPEPSTWAMMILGFLALCFVAYRRGRETPTAFVLPKKRVQAGFSG